MLIFMLEYSSKFLQSTNTKNITDLMETSLPYACLYAGGLNHSPLMCYRCCQYVFFVWQLHTVKAWQQLEVYSQQSHNALSDGRAKTGTRTCAFKSIYEEIAVLSWRMMNETASEVIEHACSDGGALQLGCACKCFPLIGSQKSFITQGEYRSTTCALEKKFNSDLMSWRTGI